MNRYILYTLILFFAAGMFFSCSEERPVGGDISTGTATLQFRVNTPAVTVSGGASTRAGTVSNQPAYENTINRVLVLLFRNNRLDEALDGNGLSSGVGSTTFRVNTRSGNASVKFYLIANTHFSAADVINRLRGKTPSEARAALDALAVAVNAHGVISPFPFWGELDMPAGLTPSSETTPTQVTGVKMVRAVARAVITKSVDDATFKPTSATIYRMNSHMAPVPEAVDGTNKVSAPTLPTNAASLAPVSGLDASSLPLTYYLPESSAAASLDASVTGATCIIIGGKFAGSAVDTYYRIDFEKDTDNNGAVDRVGEILRNHSYAFNIQSVSAPGWTTPDDAANNRPAGLVVQVQEWADAPSESFQNNAYTLTVSSREVKLAGTQGSANYIDVTTDAADFTMQWDEASPASATEIENEYFKVAKTTTGANQYRLTVTAKTTNTGSDNRTQAFNLKAGTLTVSLLIVQEIPVLLAPETTFMWVASDGSHPVSNPIGSSHTWRVESKDPWIETSTESNTLKVWGQPNHNRAAEYRTGTVRLVNNAGAEAYITVRQVRWVAWTKAFVKGGDCYRTADGLFNDYHGRTCYVYSPPGTALQLSSISADVPQLRARVLNQAAPPNYTMNGDYYTYAQAKKACESLTAGGVKWKLPTYFEAYDVSLRRTYSANHTSIVTDPDGSFNYLTAHTRAYGASNTSFNDFLMWMEPYYPPVPYSPGVVSTNYTDNFANIGMWQNGELLPLRCVRDYR